MPRKKRTNKTRVATPQRDGREKYELQLYISGATERSSTALANVKAIAEKRLHGRYRLSVVDLYQQPEKAREREVTAVPMLVKMLPLPLRRVVGDLSNEDRVLIGLDLVPKPVRKGESG